MPRDGGLASGVMARSAFLEFGRQTGRTLIQNWFVMGKARDTIDVFMCMIEIVVTDMAETLVP